MLTVVALLMLLLMILASAALYILVRRVGGMITEFVSPPAPDQPSPLALWIQAAARILAGEVTATLMASIAGQKSGLSRSIAGAEGDMVEEAVAQKSPWLSLLMAASPQITRRLRKSPMLAAALSQLNLGALGGKSGGNSHGNSVTSPSNGENPSLSLQL